MVEYRASELRRSWWIVPSLLLCAFGVLLWQVASHGPFTRFDVHARNVIQRAADSAGLEWLTRVGRDCADLGNEKPALIVLLVVTVLTTWRARSWRSALLAVGAGAVLASVIPLKIWVGRPGPGAAVLGNASLGYFPSGHTSDALCCYVVSAFLLGTFVWTGRLARRVLTGLGALVLVLTIFGLLWSNYHWVTDILGAICWCGAWLLVLRHFGAPRTQARELRATLERAQARA